MRKNIKNTVSRVRTTSTVKGDPAKADLRLIEAFAAERLLRDLFNEGDGECRVKLGPNELAWQAVRRAQDAKEQARRDRITHKGKRPVYVVSSVSLDPDSRDCSLGTIDSHVAITRAEAQEFIVNEIRGLTELKVSLKDGKGSKSAKRGFYEIDFTEGVGRTLGTRGVVFARCGSGSLTTLFTLDERWIAKRPAK